MAKKKASTRFWRKDRPQGDLFWELTICQSLADPNSPYQKALRRPCSYGGLLGEFLVRELGLSSDWSVVEVGGGYGSLMGALLDTIPLSDIRMVDISPFFSERQREMLAGRGTIRFVTSDALEHFSAATHPVDLVISNENIGDFPTVTGIRRDELERARQRGGADGPIGEVAEVADAYDLDLSDAPGIFNFNLGAVRYLEALASGNSRVKFLGRVDLQALDNLYRNCLALIVPSVGFETFGIILIEAFRNGTYFDNCLIAVPPRRKLTVISEAASIALTIMSLVIVMPRPGTQPCFLRDASKAPRRGPISETPMRSRRLSTDR